MTIFDDWNAGYLTNTSLLQSAELMQLAKAAVESDPDFLFRVQVAELPTIYVTLLRWDELELFAAQSGQPFSYPQGLRLSLCLAYIAGLNSTFEHFSTVWVQKTGWTSGWSHG